MQFLFTYSLLLPLYYILCLLMATRGERSGKLHSKTRSSMLSLLLFSAGWTFSCHIILKKISIFSTSRGVSALAVQASVQPACCI